MKHLNNKQYENITTAANALCDLINGNRTQKEKYTKYITEFAKEFAKDAKPPKKYIIVYTRTENFGNKRWSDCRETIKTAVITENTRETELNFIFDGEFVKKEKIIVGVW